jgi:hypothetical protein
MKIAIDNRLIVIGILILFFGLIIFPTTTADVNKGVLTRISSKTCDQYIIGENFSYKLLIITPSEFVDELNPLVCHKNDIGISTRIVTLCEVYDQIFWSGRDQAEKIKYFIKTAIEEWGVEYILLVGGMKGQLPFWYMPVRYVNIDCDWENRVLSDMYYADIYDSEGNFSDWDSDGDGIYGEWYYQEVPEDKYIDLYPDVAVGRLPCRNQFEVKIMVNKIINYENNAYGKEWFNDMIVCAGDTYLVSHNPLWVGYEGEYYGDRALENMTGFNPIRLYTSDGSLSDDVDVRRALKNGCGFLYFVGHGSPQTWGNHPPDSEEFVRGLTVQNVHRLRNKDMLPVCLLSGCHDLQFDVSIFKFFNKTARYHAEGTFECLGWRLTRKIGGGSIATIGCTALGFTKEDKESFEGGINELEVEFFKQYGQNHVEILGDTWKAALEWYIDTYPVNKSDWDNATVNDDAWVDVQIPQTWILFGDPSLKIGGYQV